MEPCQTNGTDRTKGTTPLLIAVHFGDMKMVQRIVETWGADVGAAGSINLNQFSVRRTSSPSTFLKLQLVGVTPLFIAALNKNSQIVRYLVAKGADVSAGVLPSTEINQDRLFGLSPLHAAFYSEDVYAPKSSEQQLDIIRFLVASGADPSVLSSNGTPVWAMGSNYLKQLGPEEDDHTAGWSKPEATTLLINLGMSLRQPCPIPLGRTLLHHLLANPVSDSYNEGVELANLLDLIVERSGTDLFQVQDEDGVTPIMAAAFDCTNQGPKMQILKTLLKRDDILPTDKINALEAAAAVLLFSHTKPSAHHFEALCDFLAQAQTLRRNENCPLIPKTSTNVETTEWVTSVSNHREIEQRIMSERLFQSIFIRLRIFSAMAPMSSKALLRYVIHPCTKRICNGFYRDPSTYPALQVLDMYWAILEAISQCNSTEEDIADGIWRATEIIFPQLVASLQLLNRRNHLLFNPNSLKTSLKLVSTIYRHQLCNFDVVHRSYLPTLLEFISMFSWFPEMRTSGEIKDLLRPIVNHNLRDQEDNTLLLLVCRLKPFPSDLRFLLACGADPNAVDSTGYGALHLLTINMWFHKNFNKNASLLLEYGTHLDIRNENGELAFDIWHQRTEQNDAKRRRVEIPNWFKGGFPKLTCMSARIIRRYNLPNVDKLPKSLQKFVRIH